MIADELVQKIGLRLVAFVVGFLIAAMILRRVDVQMYPDVFPGRVFVDEHGVKYAYEKLVISKPYTPQVGEVTLPA